MDANSLLTCIRAGIRHIAVAMIFCLVTMTVIGCSEEKTPPPEQQTTTTDARPEKMLWADMLMGPGDSSRTAWVSEMPNWPDTIVLDFDSTGHAYLNDLEWYALGEAGENASLSPDHPLYGSRVTVTLVARHIPDYKLIRGFAIDSVAVYPAGENKPAGTQYMMPSRRKFIGGVWQQVFIPTAPAGVVPQFDDNEQLHLRGYGSWGDREIRISFPPVSYEKISPPVPQAES